MLSATSSFVLSVLGWSILPDLLTSLALRFLPLLLLPIKLPPQGRTRNSRHYRITFACVVLSYLSYSLLSTSLAVPPNYYQQLGVHPTVDDATLRVAYKAWVRRNHPDKRGGGVQAESAFRIVQEGFEVLKDPVRRFAYDRFGPDVLLWMHCVTARDFLRSGLTQASGYHIVTLAGLIGFGAVGKPSAVVFWRYMLYAALFIAEFSLLLSASSAVAPLPLRLLFPRRVVYQHVLFLHQLFMFCSIALSRVVPVLFPDAVGEDELRGLEGVVERVRRLVVSLEEDVNAMLTIEFTALRAVPNSLSSATHYTPLRRHTPQAAAPPFTSLPRLTTTTMPGEEIMGQLEREMEEMVIESTVLGEVSATAQDASGGSLKARAIGGAVRDALERLASEECAGYAGRWWDGMKTVSAGSRGALVRQGLPSPRPSPSPPPESTVPFPMTATLLRRRSTAEGYLRARSVSC